MALFHFIDCEFGYSNLSLIYCCFIATVPKIEDGNNFGVAVQEETLGEIQSVESEAAAFFDQISRYFISRAKIVSKVAKYPHIDDYRRAVQASIFLILHQHIEITKSVQNWRVFNHIFVFISGIGWETVSQSLACHVWSSQPIFVTARHCHQKFGKVEKAPVVECWRTVLVTLSAYFSNVQKKKQNKIDMRRW